MAHGLAGTGTVSSRTRGAGSAAANPTALAALRRRLLDQPGDVSTLRRLVSEFDARSQPGRALACIAGLRLLDSRRVDRAEWLERRALARKHALEARRAERARLSERDETHVSVIVPTYDRPEWLHRALESIARQTFSDFEVVVVNDGGDPRAEEVVREFGRLRIRYLQKDNGGLSAARNHGLLEARGRYIAYLDDDDVYYPDHLAVLTGHLDRSGYAMAYSCGLRLEKVPAGDGWRLEKASIAFSKQADARVASHGNFTPVLSVVHRRDALLRTGLFDREIFSVQDWHLWRRFTDRFEIEHVPVLTGEYDLRSGASSMQGGAPEEHRFHELLIRLEWLERARRWETRARRSLARGDARLAALFWIRAWNLGLEVERYLVGVSRLSRVSPALATQLVVAGSGELVPYVRGAWHLIARGAEARTRLGRRFRRQRLLQQYADAQERGLSLARKHGFEG